MQCNTGWVLCVTVSSESVIKVNHLRIHQASDNDTTEWISISEGLDVEPLILFDD
jgi:hypothetical protein